MDLIECLLRTNELSCGEAMILASSKPEDEHRKGVHQTV